ncbi:uncharacterized protein LOC142576124 isoform X1 [Dermacentor variabilis]|uniref:uncharacterized protein LOC142576124 isoform X1 n=1 Tax=Dermacentor variabilis TaxID=34621 RepID=UPI003F5C36F1
MGRARKDSFNQPPVETYRKFIGKHENKKSKSDIKESKKRVQSKKTKSKTYKPLEVHSRRRCCAVLLPLERTWLAHRGLKGLWRRGVPFGCKINKTKVDAWSTLRSVKLVAETGRCSASH